MEGNLRMTCREYQFLIGTEKPAELAGAVALQTHLRQCADCAQAYSEMRQLSAATSLLQPLAPPADFTQRVRRQVRETAQVNSAGFLEKLVGPLRAPAPALQRRHVFAGLAVILVALVLLTVLIQPAGIFSSTPSFNVPSIAQPGGGQPVDFPATQPGGPTRSSQTNHPGAPAHAP